MIVAELDKKYPGHPHHVFNRCSSVAVGSETSLHLKGPPLMSKAFSAEGKCSFILPDTSIVAAYESAQ